MYLIYKRNIHNLVIFNSLDDIKKAVTEDIYGKCKSSSKSNQKNVFEAFKIVDNPSFPIQLCNNYSIIANIIFKVDDNKNYYLFDENHYAHGVWEMPGIDGTKTVFNNIIKMEEYCDRILRNTSYLPSCDDYSDEDDENCNTSVNDIILKKKKFMELTKSGINDVSFTIGDDFYCDITIKKIL